MQPPLLCVPNSFRSHSTTLHYKALRYFTLSCFTLSYFTLLHLTLLLLYITLHRFTLRYLALFYFVLPYPVLSLLCLMSHPLIYNWFCVVLKKYFFLFLETTILYNTDVIRHYSIRLIFFLLEPVFSLWNLSKTFRKGACSTSASLCQ